MILEFFAISNLVSDCETIISTLINKLEAKLFDTSCSLLVCLETFEINQETTFSVVYYMQL